MTVKELKNLLNSASDDTEVMMCTHEWNHDLDVPIDYISGIMEIDQNYEYDYYIGSSDKELKRKTKKVIMLQSYYSTEYGNEEDL